MKGNIFYYGSALLLGFLLYNYISAGIDSPKVNEIPYWERDDYKKVKTAAAKEKDDVELMAAGEVVFDEKIAGNITYLDEEGFVEYASCLSCDGKDREVSLYLNKEKGLYKTVFLHRNEYRIYSEGEYYEWKYTSGEHYFILEGEELKQPEAYYRMKQFNHSGQLIPEYDKEEVFFLFPEEGLADDKESEENFYDSEINFDEFKGHNPLYSHHFSERYVEEWVFSEEDGVLIDVKTGLRYYKK